MLSDTWACRMKQSRIKLSTFWLVADCLYLLCHSHPGFRFGEVIKWFAFIKLVFTGESVGQQTHVRSLIAMVSCFGAAWVSIATEEMNQKTKHSYIRVCVTVLQIPFLSTGLLLTFVLLCVCAQIRRKLPWRQSGFKKIKKKKKSLTWIEEGSGLDKKKLFWTVTHTEGIN